MYPSNRVFGLPRRRHRQPANPVLVRVRVMVSASLSSAAVPVSKR